MDRLMGYARLPAFFLGLAVFFSAQRYLAAESYFLSLKMASLVMVLGGALMTVLLIFRAKSRGDDGEARAWFFSSAWMLAVALGLGLFEAYRAALGERPAPETFGDKFLLAAWLMFVGLGLFAGAGVEWSRRESGHGPLAEPGRVARSGRSWLTVGMLAVALVGLNFAAAKKDVVRDLSYLKVTTPSKSTLALIKTLDKDMQIALFYPQGNEVKGLIVDYFETLARAEPRIKLNFYDKDMHPTQAETFRVSRNGQIVLEFDGERSRLDTGTKLSKARKTVRKLDGEFQQRFREATAQKKIAYFTRGHGELSWLGDARDNPLRSLRSVEAFLRQQSYTLKLFGIAEGSLSGVPDDASVVVIAGPRTPFQQEEVDHLRAYLERGGALLVMMDLDKPDDDANLPQGGASGNDPLQSLLSEAGIRFVPEPLANDKNHVSATRSPADKWFIYSNVFTSHESVVSLARHEERIAVLVYQGGRLELGGAKPGWKAVETVRSLSDTFIDTNRNFSFDKGENRKTYVLGAVSEKKVKGSGGAKGAPQSGRIVAFSDATLASDAILRNPGNLLYISDSLKYLAGEAELAGEVATEEDVKIRHTRKEDAIWFSGTIFGMPLLVLGVGFVATRRKQAGQSKSSAQKSASQGDSGHA